VSEQTPEVPATDASVEQPNAPQAEQPKPTETVDFWKQKAREQEQRAKSNADKAREYDAFQESQKTEQQRIADRAAAAERERDEARAEGLRYKAAAKHGVGEDYFDLLGSGDEETISTRAERVGSLLRVAAENEQLKAELEALRAGRPSPTQGRPVEALRPGATPSDIQSEDAEFAQYAAALNIPIR
jgi:hypothetical protein